MIKRKVYLEDIPLDETWRRFIAAMESAGTWEPFRGEDVPLDESLGRVTARPVWAALSSPGYHASAMVVAGLFLVPVVWRLQGVVSPPERRRVTARLAHNIASVPGREDYVSVKLVEREGQLWADPVFGKSNLIYTLVKADGSLHVPLDSNGLHEDEQVEVELF